MSNNREGTDEYTAQEKSGISRRKALGMAGLGGLGILSTQSAAGQQDGRGNQPFYNWREDVDANGHALEDLGSLSMADNPTAIRDFTGDNLNVDDGVLHADVPDTEGVWEDTTDDGLLETPDHNGIDVTVVQTEELNDTAWVETTEGAAAVQSATDTHDHVIVYGPGATWSGSVSVPSDTTVRRIGSGTITISDPATVLSQYDAPHGGTTAVVFTNADHTNGNENVYIEGFDIDYNGTGVTVDPSVYYAGVWLRNAHSSVVEGVSVDNVVPHASDNGSRAYGIVVTDCIADGETDGRVIIRDCRATRCGYEGMGARGENHGVLFEDCEAYDTDTHSFQAAGWTGSSATSYTGRPSNITFRGCAGDNTFIHHGFSTEKGKDERILFENCTMSDARSAKIQIYETCRNDMIRDCTGQVDIKTRTGGEIRDITIENLTSNMPDGGISNSPVYLSAQGNDWEVNGLTIRDTHIDQDKLLTVYDRGLDAGANYRIRNITLENCSLTELTAAGASMLVRPLHSVETENLTIRDCYADASRFIHGAGIIDAAYIHNNDARDVNDIVTSSGTTIAAASNNLGFDPEGPTDLSNVAGYWSGQTAVDDGTNTTNGNLETFVWDTDTWYSASGEMITP